MKRQRFLWIMSSLLLVAVFAWSTGDTFAKKPVTLDDQAKKFGKMTPSEQKAAAKQAAKLGMKPGVAGFAPMAAAVPLPGIEGPGGVPHYFGPYGNWAFSPLPKGTLNPALTVDSGGSGYAVATTTVTINDAYDSTLSDTATVAVDAAGAITTITLNAGGSGTGYSAPVVTITGAGTGAAATATLTSLTGGMRKFVDKMPGLTPAGANALGQYIPLGVPEDRTFSGQVADYYEIALVEYQEKMHSDLPPTRQRGYVQLSTIPGVGIPLTNPDGSAILKPDGTPALGLDKPHFLGPVIVAKGRAHGVAGPAGEPKPVRIKFYNLLPPSTTTRLLVLLEA